MLNIRNVRGFGIAQAVRAVDLGGFELMVLTEMRISVAVYFRNRLGYEIFCLLAQPASSGGIAGRCGPGLVGPADGMEP